MSKLSNNTEGLNEILAAVNALPEAGGDDYVLPVATETALGGVKAPAKTGGMTQPVGVDSEGFLFVTPAEKVNIPTALPNPNALTFTGAVTGSYDGSAPMTVEIPQGGSGGGDWELLLSGATYTEGEDGFTYFDTELEGLDGAKEIMFVYTWTPNVAKNAENGFTSGDNGYMQLTLGDYSRDIWKISVADSSTKYVWHRIDVCTEFVESAFNSGVSMVYNIGTIAKLGGVLNNRTPLKGNAFKFRNRLNQKIAGTFTIVNLFVKH